MTENAPCTLLRSTLRTPTGPFTVVASRQPSGDLVVLASGWTDDVGALLPQVHPSLRGHGAPEAVATLGAVTDAVIAYHDGDLTAVDAIEVHQRSGPFLEHAWVVLRTVPAGHPVTYAAYADACGNPTAVRAAAAACARNAAALFVPCHRVIRTGGGMGGFRWGLEVKRWLLAHEEGARSA
jgi:methylated-DNA-[protein]-cysteine S-methyltransferase